LTRASILIAACTALLLPLAVGCEEGSSSHSVAVTVASVGDALSLDPAAVSDSESMQVAMQVCEPLVRSKKGWAEMEPALATSWTVSKDGTEWTFRLRSGVLFHDGSPFNADAVVFSLERQRDRAHPFHFEAFTYWESTYKNIQRVTKIDDLTVRIRTDRPYAPFLANLAMFPASIVSPTAMQKLGRRFASSPVGTGPFRFVRWDKGERIILERNPRYWGRKPKVEHLIFEVIPDASQRLTSLQSGTVDVAQGIAPSDRQIVKLHPDLSLIRVAGFNVAYLAMNTHKPPFDDLRVRRAVNYAVNKHAIVKFSYQGLALPAVGPIPPEMWGYDRNVRLYPHDPDLARRLLAEAGYDQTLVPRFYVMSTPRPYFPSPVLVGKMIARNLADVGMKVELVIQTWKEHQRSTQMGEHDLCLGGWANDNGDPDNLLYLLLDKDNARRGAARNLAMFTDDRLHEILVSAQTALDRRVREKKYLLAQEIVADLAPWVPLAHSDVVVATRAEIHDLFVQPSTLIDYSQVVKD
jgi:peptide/nickel transport system substrate-binding protein